MSPLSGDYQPDLRRVRKLSLSVDEPGRQFRGVRMIEEALRLLNLPGEIGGRVFYIRKARFPAICDAETSWHYAYLVEKLCRQLTQDAIHLRERRAASANAAFAHSPVEPWAHLAQRLATGSTCEEWFWAAATPGLPEDRSRQSLPTILRRVYAIYGWTGVIEFLKSCSPATLRSILQQLTAADVEVLGVKQSTAKQLHHTYQTTPQPRGVNASFAPSRGFSSLSLKWRELCVQFIPAWTADDARSHWLCTAALVVVSPEKLLDMRLPSEAAALSQAIADQARESASAAAIGREWPHENIGSFTSATPVEAPDDATNPEPPRTLPTRYAGFFFLLNLLNRLGLVETLSANPELIDLHFTSRLLRTLMRTTGIDPDDAIAEEEWQAPPPALVSDPPLAFNASMLPRPWRHWKSPGTSWTLARLLRAWQASIRHEARHLTGLSLAAIVSRPGTFGYTDTHLDVYLSQDTLDIRIRRAALDVDPGWLPWLGKVVAFHYECETRELPPR